jgi:hypothetical protein
VRPLHYAALRTPDTTSAQQLARWLLVPVGPAYTAEEVSHAILGIAKTVDYPTENAITLEEAANGYTRIVFGALAGPAAPGLRGG